MGDMNWHNQFWNFRLNDCNTWYVTAYYPTAAARVRARVWQVGFVVDKMVSGQVFSE
jgi:hypothetical protein